MHPHDRHYTSAHEWVLPVGSSRVRVGITQFAAESLGDVVFVSLPELGQEVSAGSPCAEVESTKSVSDVYAPVSGVVAAVNDGLIDTPESVNADPFGAGWMFEIDLADGADAGQAASALMSADVYEQIIRSHARG